MSDKNISSGCNVFYSHNGETLSLREWAIRWLGQHETNWSPSNLEIRSAVKVLSRRLEVRSFAEAISTPKYQCQVHRNQSRSGPKGARKVDHGGMTWRDNSGRSLGEIRQALLDLSAMFDGLPQCGGWLQIINSRVL